MTRFIVEMDVSEDNRDIVEKLIDSAIAQGLISIVSIRYTDSPLEGSVVDGWAEMASSLSALVEGR